MPGTLLDSFYQGNRIEYLAHYVLFALGVAVKVPHEEDIGADSAIADTVLFNYPF